MKVNLPPFHGLHTLTFLTTLLLVCFMYNSDAQIDIEYQLPHKDILDIADATPSPLISMDEAGKVALLLYRNKYKSIDELSEVEMRLAGLRINPITFSGSRTNFYNFIKILSVQNKKEIAVEGLPHESKISNLSWSPDESKVAFTITESGGVALWLLDMATASAKRITDSNLNATYGSPFVWLRDNSGLLVKMIPQNRPVIMDQTKVVPSGPTVSVNDGSKAQNRTYQDLLKNKVDEDNFENLTTSEIWKVSIDGQSIKWGNKAMYAGMSLSPDGKYVLLSKVNRPFSYIVPASRFPRTYTIVDLDGNEVHDLYSSPLLEEIPKGFMATQTGPRSINWRSDLPSTLYWAEALDEGDPDNEVEYRDAVYQLNVPVKGDKTLLFKTKLRYSSIYWGNDETAIARSMWWNTRTERTEVFNPSDQSKSSKLLNERNYQDNYNDPGFPAFENNEYGRSVLALREGNIFLVGDGWSDEGKHPFIDQLNLNNGEKKRLFQTNKNEKLENIIRIINIDKGIILTRIESQEDFPNYYLRGFKNNTLEAVTAFPNPIQILQNVHKEIITYQREDGLELSGTLYLPVDYDKDKKEKMPMIMWAYPREYKDVSTAGQVTSSPNQFTFPNYGSPVFWVNRGYVVLDAAAFPIVGEGDDQPNDSFIKQLVSNAKAAIDAVDALGYIDRNRVAVGGHSYGAFMTANLLSNCDLFAAGIARSGAYNRTLTPFGFQAEERNYWEAPEVYYAMSPFMHADKMKTPMLLIHGEADNNSGTFPMQSERYFNALKGLGATVRLVLLPKESHGYASRESVMHMLWEQDQWLEKYVKNKHKLAVQTP